MKLRGGMNRRFDSEEDEEVLWRDGKVTMEDLLGEPVDKYVEKQEKKMEEQEDWPLPDGVKPMRDGWYDNDESDSAVDQAEEELYNSTRSFGEPPYGNMWMLFNGSKFRNPDMFLHENETDVEMISRRYLGRGPNDTAFALRERLKTAVMLADVREVQELVLDEGLHVGVLLDEWSHEQAIHYAAWHGHLGVVRALLDLGADPGARNYFNQAPIHRAAAGGYTEICAELVERGAVPIETDKMNFSAPEWAAEFQFNETCQWFFANFVSDLNFPQGPAPHYGFAENEGYEYWAPEPSGQNVTQRMFMDSLNLTSMFGATALDEESVERAFAEETARRLEIDQALAEQGGEM